VQSGDCSPRIPAPSRARNTLRRCNGVRSAFSSAGSPPPSSPPPWQR
jgi:hypothetical protein